ncbi:MAG TPA: gluconate 2-dehydrogenase subunit 3 family protein [Cyclobacteriaceae bacterium]|nr:gluconate 2-dehydrogenase subunit 3 family protein [Cyclobacteriaceae bacterium]
MNRREAIQRTAMVLGYAVSGPALLGVLNGCKATPEAEFKPEFLSMEQALLVEELAEIIIPKTDTPGAKEAGVPMFIDKLVKDVYSPDDQERFIKNLIAFDDEAKKTYGSSFIECSAEEKDAHFRKAHDEIIQKLSSNGPSGWWNVEGKESKPFMVEIKELTLLGFFTSEPGATQVLQYNQVPGPYKGCLPLTEVGKQWAT